MLEPTNTASGRSHLQARLLDAETRCSQWLADGNVASSPDRAQQCYDKSQFWLDRANRLREAIYAADAQLSSQLTVRNEAPGIPAQD